MQEVCDISLIHLTVLAKITLIKVSGGIDGGSTGGASRGIISQPESHAFMNHRLF